MPEGDTIWRAAAALRARFVGRRVTEAQPRALARLAGRVLTAVESAGKHLTLRFDDGLGLHTHMRMTGSWHLYGPAERWRRPAWQATCVLRFEDGVAVLFAAPVCELVRDDNPAVAHLGPDILAADFDLDEVLARARSSPVSTAGELLLDQRVCAGIGNIYKCETLHRLRLHPWTPVSSLDDAVLGACYRTARDLMRRALVGDGFRHPAAVHGRSGHGCTRCGTRIQVRPQGAQARLTYWCPRCQPGVEAQPPAVRVAAGGE